MPPRRFSGTAPGPGPIRGRTGAEAAGCSVPEGLERLVQLFPRVMRGLRRSQVGSEAPPGLRSRHRSALALVCEGDISVGGMAASLGLTLPTASGLVADLERAGFVARSVDPSDRRRTLVTIVPGRRTCAEQWLEGTTAPIARALERLTPEERGAFVKAMAHLDTELGANPPENSAPPG